MGEPNVTIERNAMKVTGSLGLNAYSFPLKGKGYPRTSFLS